MARKKNMLLIKNADDKDRIFYEYRDKVDIGKQLLGDFMGYDLIKNQQGFSIQQGDEIGVVSQCYGLLTLIEYSKFGVALTAKAVANKFNDTLNYILNQIIEENGNLKFEAFPHISVNNDKCKIEKYIETATLFLRILLGVRKMLCVDYEEGTNTIVIDTKYVGSAIDNQEQTKKEIECVQRWLIQTMDFITGAALKVNGDIGIDYVLTGTDTPLIDDYGDNLKYKGWSFSEVPEDGHAKTEISLYHTYLVGEAYLAFYEAFGGGQGGGIDKLRELRNEKRNAIKRDDENRQVSIGEIAQELHKIISEQSLEDKDPCYSSNKNLKRDVEFLCDNFISYTKFNKTMLDAGHYVDMKSREVDTTKSFFSYNFNVVTAEDIENSSSNDAMFNVLFAINIMMAAGVDKDYSNLTDDDLEEFYDRLRYSIPNVQRFYRQLKRAGKEDMFDKYMLKLSSAIPYDDMKSKDSLMNQARALRNEHIVAFTLLPLIVKTHCTVSAYTIQYPQYEIKGYKDDIVAMKMENRWLWDKDAFNLVNNYHYVNVLGDIYTYYYKYEHQFAIEEARYIAPKEKEIEEQKKKYEEKEKEYNELLQTKKELEAQKVKDIQDKEDEWQQRYDRKQGGVENAIEAHMNEWVKKALIDILKQEVFETNKRCDKLEDNTNELSQALMLACTSYFTSLRRFLTTEENKGDIEAAIEMMNRVGMCITRGFRQGSN